MLRSKDARDSVDPDQMRQNETSDQGLHYWSFIQQF